jgi:hypothetical protein
MEVILVIDATHLRGGQHYSEEVYVDLCGEEARVEVAFATTRRGQASPFAASSPGASTPAPAASSSRRGVAVAAVVAVAVVLIGGVVVRSAISSGSAPRSQISQSRVLAATRQPNTGTIYINQPSGQRTGSGAVTVAPVPTQQPTAPPSPTAPPTPVPTPQPYAGQLLRLGQAAENQDVELNVSRVDIRASGDSEDAAAHVSYRFFNKSGQRLLVEGNWNDFVVMDASGRTYLDWDNGGPISVWVEPSASFNFDRYYSLTPGKRSRIPSSEAYAVVLVTKLSRLANARWQVPISQPLLDQSDVGATLPLNQSWQQNGVQFMLKQLDIRAGSDDEGGAAHATLVLTNRSGQPIRLDLDFSRIAMRDSQGVRFIDWDGGGIQSQNLGPGQSVQFDRYYSVMAGVRSRVTTGAQWVVLSAANFGPVDQVQWQVNVVH